MKRLLDSIMYEFKLNLFNKSIFIVLILMITFLLLNYSNCIKDFEVSKKTYQITYKSLIEDGEDVDALLQQEYHINEEYDASGGLTQFIDNTIRYDYENMQEKFDDIYWKNCVISMLKRSTLIYLGLLCSLYMIFMSTYDFANNTLKTHMLIESPLQIVWSKFISGLIIITGIYFFALAFSWLITSVWSSIYLKKIIIEETVTVYGIKMIIKSILVSYLVIMLFSIISYALAFLLRNMAVAVGVNIMLHLLIPSFGKYDYKNLIMTVYKSAYNLEQSASLNYYDGVNSITAFIMVILYACIIFMVASIRFYKNWRNGQIW